MNDPDKPPFDVSHVSKTYRQGRIEVTALNDVSLSAEPGEFISIMGASGSGKSSLLHVLAGLTDIDSGKVEIAGHDLAKMSDASLTRFRRANIGLVFQSFNLIPALSAEANIRLPASATSDLDRQVDSLLERLGLQDRRHQKPTQLSGGEQQRVAIARALIRNPSLILADEPTGSLDSHTGQDICRLLRELSDEHQCAIVLVTHEPNVAMWADRVVILKDGKNVAEFAPTSKDDPQLVASQYQELVRQEAAR